MNIGLNDDVNNNVQKLDIGVGDFMRHLKTKKSSSIAGVPPGDMNPIGQEWWDICRKPDEFTQETGVGRCFDCFNLCASHPETEGGGGIMDCLSGAFSLCLLPEIQESFAGFGSSCKPWEEEAMDQWSSDTCNDYQSCAGECQNFCRDQPEFDGGVCEEDGDQYLCTCY